MQAKLDKYLKPILTMSNVQHIQESEYIKRAGKTARPWKSTTVYNAAIQQVIKKGDKVLDYGSGPYQLVKPRIEKLGATYLPYDKYNNIGQLTLNNDVVMASNVLNVSVYAGDPLHTYQTVIDELVKSLAKTGKLVVNMPTLGPRSDWMTPNQLKKDLLKRLQTVIKVDPTTFIASDPI